MHERISKQLKKIKNTVNIFWFRRDLRLEDNHGLFQALNSDYPVIALFIFDTHILDTLNDKSDARVSFIFHRLNEINNALKKFKSSLLILVGEPESICKDLIRMLNVHCFYTNHDYEPYAIARDEKIKKTLTEKQIRFKTFKDQVIFEKDEILTNEEKPYTIYTPYKKRWLETIQFKHVNKFPSEKLTANFLNGLDLPFPNLDEIGFKRSSIKMPDKIPDIEKIKSYHLNRDYPARDGTTRLGLHIRFGTVSIRSLVDLGMNTNETWLSELIWREFFMMVLWHFPYVEQGPFKKQYGSINWRNDEDEFEKWCHGETGYPLVDAGMHELNATGFMHNRVRMVTASFLTKHLLIDWRRGEKYFAEKLLDFELASNNGNWQWAAGCGCDAAPYFRIFNPGTQLAKFDPDLAYVKKWAPAFGTNKYPKPIVEHTYARNRVLNTYKAAVNKFKANLT
ncbi:MAG: deoxyribodipyrimidine photo-lyase [Calditrichaceae bacterium]|nr:deoxyribodipyrimidine photo-lyase [Calditrichaceae bacterium]